MKMIITGATGSLGAYLTRWFAQKGHDIIAVGRMETPPPRLNNYAKYFRADIGNSLSLPDADVCIHSAAIANDKATANELYRANVKGTKNVVMASNACKIFVQVSTSSVYVHSHEKVSENMAGEKKGARLSAYGKSKLLAEEILLETAKNDSCFILRPRAIYGAGDKVLLPRLLNLVRNNKMLRTGTMNVNLSMTHFSNFALAVEDCIKSGKNGTHIYNVADDETYVLYDALKKILTELYQRELEERKIPLWLLKCMSALRIGEATPLFVNTVSKSLVLDLTKIKDELNYAPVTNLTAGVKEIANWVKAVGGIDIVKQGNPGLAWEG